MVAAIIIESIILLIVSIIVFFPKAFINRLGQRVAEISTAKKLTSIEETVKQEFRKGIEEYKAQLSKQLSSEIEPLKAELQKNSDRHKIQYEYLHNSRSKVIRELYENLVNLHFTFSEYMSPYQTYVGENIEQQHKERGVEASRALTKFIKFFLLNKIYFDKSFCGTMDAFIKKCRVLIVTFVQNERNLEIYKNTREEKLRTFYDKIDAIQEEIEKVFPIEIEKLENELRSYIMHDGK